MYFDDLTPYTYSDSRFAEDDARDLVNVGWLDLAHDYPRAEADPEIVKRLLGLAEGYVNAMCGFHRCPFCDSTEQVMMLLDDEPVYLGSAEIRLQADDRTFVAPNLLPHYMALHQYKPPDDVLAVLADLPGP